MIDFKVATEMMELPPKAMSYDGKFLENIFQGYLTLDVSGRESIEMDIQSDSVLVGSKISTQQIKSKTLTINFGFLFEDVDEVQKIFNSLRQYLYRTDDVPIMFNDEKSTYYFGRLINVSDPEYENENFATGEFQIFCQDPLKYSKEKQTSNQITINSPVETTPSRIEVKLSTGSSIKITNKNTSAVISITGAAIYSGNTLIFDFEKGLVLVNGVDKTAILDLASDFENFYVHRGDQLSCTNGEMIVYVREVYV